MNRMQQENCRKLQCCLVRSSVGIVCDPSPFKQLLGLQLDDLIFLQPLGFSLYDEEARREELHCFLFFIPHISGSQQLLNEAVSLSAMALKDLCIQKFKEWRKKERGCSQIYNKKKRQERPVYIAFYHTYCYIIIYITCPTAECPLQFLSVPF